MSKQRQLNCGSNITINILQDVPEVAPLSVDAQKALSDIIARFDAGAAQKVKDIEATTNHDVKAVEYYLKDAFAASGSAELLRVAEFLHFACTSEDINNLAYALMVKGAREGVMAPAMNKVIDSIAQIGETLADAPMMSRTHGQPATPTTMGKEFANFAYRLGRQLKQFNAVEIAGKFNGAVGNFNAHVVAYPSLGACGWVGLGRQLVEGQLGLRYNPYSTQVRSCHGSVSGAVTQLPLQHAGAVLHFLRQNRRTLRWLVPELMRNS